MKIKKGLPSGMMFVEDSLHPMVQKLVRLSSEDLKEMEAFMDYLLQGPEQISEPAEKRPLKMYDFMSGNPPEKQNQSES